MGKITTKTLTAILVFIGVVSLFLMAIPMFMTKEPVKQTIQTSTGDNSPQFNFNAPTSNVQFNYNVYNDSDAKKYKEENERLKKELEQLRPTIAEYANRPKIVVGSPSVIITNWKDGSIVYGEKVNGCVTANFNINLVNIGGHEAINLTQNWKIVDNDNPITGLNEWRKLIGKGPLIIKSLSPSSVANLIYGPHITCYGAGTLDLIIEYEYTDAVSNEKYTEQFKGRVEYKAEKNSKPKFYLITPI
ncbi:MAG: hypothetical protein WC404_01535 [Candidatus Omnitrophota bacterium]|jgi:hypothetical protein